jgi:hypothetical protein
MAEKKEGAPAGAPWFGKIRSSQINVTFPFQIFEAPFIQTGSPLASWYKGIN